MRVDFATVDMRCMSFSWQEGVVDLGAPMMLAVTAFVLGSEGKSAGIRVSASVSTGQTVTGILYISIVIEGLIEALGVGRLPFVWWI